MQKGAAASRGRGCGYSMNCSSWMIVFNTFGMIAPRGVGENNDFIGPNYVIMADFFEGAKAGKYKAFIKAQGSPVHNSPNRSRWIEDTFPDMELVVDYDIWMTDTGEYADYVLPDCMPFECLDLVNQGAYGHVVLQEPAIEPVGDNKPPACFYTELAKRVGLGDFFQKAEEEHLVEMLSLPFPFPPFDYLDPPLTWERLKAADKLNVIPIRLFEPVGVTPTRMRYILKRQSPLFDGDCPVFITAVKYACEFTA